VSAHHSIDTRQGNGGAVLEHIRTQLVEKRMGLFPSELQDTEYHLLHYERSIQLRLPMRWSVHRSSTGGRNIDLSSAQPSLVSRCCSHVIFHDLYMILKDFERVPRSYKGVPVVCSVYWSQHRQPDLWEVARRSVEVGDISSRRIERDK
jgi:hypothetical protein